MKFGEALELLKDGYPVYRESWDGYTYVIKQVNSDITKDIVPKMQSLPNLAKNLILEGGDGSISYRQQCLSPLSLRIAHCLTVSVISSQPLKTLQVISIDSP